MRVDEETLALPEGAFHVRRDERGVELHLEGARVFRTRLDVRATCALESTVPRLIWELRVRPRRPEWMVNAMDLFWHAREQVMQAIAPVDGRASGPMLALAAILQRASVHAVALCDPTLLRLVRTFRPAERLGVLRLLQRDRTGRLARLVEMAPGALLFAARSETSARPHLGASALLVHDVVEGRPLDEALDAALEQAAASCRANPPCAEHATRAEQHLLIRLASARVPGRALLHPPPLPIVAQEIPRELTANATWYDVLLALRGCLTSPAPSSLDLSLWRFLSRHCRKLPRAKELAIGVDVWAWNEFVRSTGRAPDERTSPESFLDAHHRWFMGLGEAYAASSVQDWLALCPADAAARVPPPPLPASRYGVDWIEPILSVEELVREAFTQGHPPELHPRDFLAGHEAYYRAEVRGERLTVQLCRWETGWALGELRGRRDAEVSDAARGVLEAWVSEVLDVRRSTCVAPASSRCPIKQLRRPDRGRKKGERIMDRIQGQLRMAAEAIGVSHTWRNAVLENVFWASFEALLQSALLTEFNRSGPKLVVARARSLSATRWTPDLIVVRSRDVSDWLAADVGPWPHERRIGLVQGVIEVKEVWTRSCCRSNASMKARLAEIGRDRARLAAFQREHPRTRTFLVLALAGGAQTFEKVEEELEVAERDLEKCLEGTLPAPTIEISSSRACGDDDWRIWLRLILVPV